MTRRATSDEAGFGSDSFLDIIANIVGILIILIVVAGVRASKLTPTAAPLSIPSAHKTAQPVEVESSAASPAMATVLEQPSIVEDTQRPVEAPRPPTPRQPSPALVAALDERMRTLTALQAQGRKLSTAIDGMTRERQRLSREAELGREALQAGADSVNGAQARLDRLQQDIEAAKRELAERRRQLDVLASEQPKTPTIRHRVTPLSREVETELHFLVTGGRVAWVPIDELVERLRREVHRQREWIVRFHKHQGLVGPVNGFSLAYVVERETLSVLEELRQGTGMVRASVSGWKIIPESDYPSESAEEALRPGSGFTRRLQLTDLDTALTFWVYPDSFELFRQLQDHAHREGFTVAARPMPFGVPIAASPQGSRSAGQ
ncbi:MAG: hypothetical protein KY476_01260 [Planctomycetes bacterium]|nr:hypothetical protein [Planctomycetota bacterium]